MKEKKIIMRHVLGRTVHVRRGSFAHYAIDWAVPAVEIGLACGIIFLLGYIVGWN